MEQPDPISLRDQAVALLAEALIGHRPIERPIAAAAAIVDAILAAARERQPTELEKAVAQEIKARYLGVRDADR